MRRLLMWQSILLLILNINTFIHANQQDEIIVDSGQSEKDLNSFQIKHNMLELKTRTFSPLAVTENDILWEFSKDGEYVDLVIRKKKHIRSVLLTNMYYGDKYVGDYGHTPYGLKAKGYNSVNGNEYRLVNKKMIGKSREMYFLVDSNPEAHYLFGLAFRIRIPKVVEYGYKNAGENYGVITISKGVTLNLRSYARKYADHRGKFVNNVVQIDFNEQDYNNRIKPTITKIKEFREKGYKVIMVKYHSRVEYIKYFLIRDLHVAKAFRRISFVNRKSKAHKTAILVRANYKQGYGITVTALIYIKDLGHEKDYDIAAIDQQNRVSKGYITVVNKQKGQEKTLPPDKDSSDPENIIIDNEFDGAEEDFFNKQ